MREELALKHSIQLAKIEKRLKKIEDKLREENQE